MTDHAALALQPINFDVCSLPFALFVCSFAHTSYVDVFISDGFFLCFSFFIVLMMFFFYFASINNMSLPLDTIFICIQICFFDALYRTQTMQSHEMERIVGCNIANICKLKTHLHNYDIKRVEHWVLEHCTLKNQASEHQSTNAHM